MDCLSFTYQSLNATVMTSSVRFYTNRKRDIFSKTYGIFYETVLLAADVRGTGTVSQLPRSHTSTLYFTSDLQDSFSILNHKLFGLHSWLSSCRFTASDRSVIKQTKSFTVRRIIIVYEATVTVETPSFCQNVVTPAYQFKLCIYVWNVLMTLMWHVVKYDTKRYGQCL